MFFFPKQWLQRLMFSATVIFFSYECFPVKCCKGELQVSSNNLVKWKNLLAEKKDKLKDITYQSRGILMESISFKSLIKFIPFPELLRGRLHNYA